MTDTPILFLVFNRPETTAQVFEAIRAARPRRLFVAADGPRPNCPGEAARCDEVRRASTAIDWPCEVKTLFRPQNLGCQRAVSTAIDWYFSQVDEGIVLEDDCVPDPSFFAYCTELLQRHRDNPKVMSISGDNFIAAHWQPPQSYYFSVFSHIWGWATWRRAWQHYDVEMRDWPAQRDSGLLKRLFPQSRAAQFFWTQVLDRTARGEIDTWDYQWTYACWKQQGLTCLPALNIVTNIGFGAGATHTHDAESVHANLARRTLPLPLRHPNEIGADAQADAWTLRHVFHIDDPLLKLKRRLLRVAGSLGWPLRH